MTETTAGYLCLLESGELEERVRRAGAVLQACTLCPHGCLADRLQGEPGFCGTGAQAVVASHGAHFGEEAPLVGRRGSGTVFFSGCNLACVYCQNWDLSHEGAGRAMSAEGLAACFLAVQEEGCHNLNLVSPTHVVPMILAALVLAARRGLCVPIVYNTGGYDALSTLRLLDGVVDIYMPDFKYWDPGTAERYSGAFDYPQVARQALREMHRQVGDLEISPHGLARRGLLVRHLVLPGGIAGTPEVMDFLAKEISVRTYVNVMAQYRPCGMARRYPPLDRRITAEEFAGALGSARQAGLTRLDMSGDGPWR